jgi:acyl-CoA thioesterase I
MRFILQLVAIWFLPLILVQSCSPAEESNKNESSSAEPAPEQVKEENKKTVLFFGNSLTAGYGLSPEEAFPSLIQDRIDSLGYNYQVVNAGLSGETTSSGKNRLDWVLERQKVDVFVLELGANDGLRGIDTEETRKNLVAMIEKARATYPNITIILAGMEVPPNMGPEYTAEFRQVFREVVEEKSVALIPFLLAQVAGNPELNQPDGIHPTAEGHEIVANNVWKVLKSQLDKNA